MCPPSGSASFRSRRKYDSATNTKVTNVRVAVEERPFRTRKLYKIPGFSLGGRGPHACGKPFVKLTRDIDHRTSRPVPDPDFNQRRNLNAASHDAMRAAWCERTSCRKFRHRRHRAFNGRERNGA